MTSTYGDWAAMPSAAIADSCNRDAARIELLAAFVPIFFRKKLGGMMARPWRNR
jgi:hypothetical protein